MHLNELQPCMLFSSIAPSICIELIKQLQPHEAVYEKGQVLVLAGDSSTRLGIVLCGSITAWQERYDGTQHPVVYMGAGGVFADMLSACGGQSPVTVTAACGVRVLWLSYQRLLSPSLCVQPMLNAARLQMLQNLTMLMAQKYFAQQARMEAALQPTLRRKLLYYLDTLQPDAQGCRQIPFTREMLAGWLGCERSALCRELSRMVRQEYLKIDGRSVWLLKRAEEELA